MATHLGNTTEMYGHKYNISVTNVCGKDLLESEDLASRMLIVSSQANANKEDLGTVSMFMTDYEGKPVRLTYTIIPGNGLVQGEDTEQDQIKMAIDNESICVDYQDGSLYINKGNIVDNSTIQVDSTLGTATSRGKLFVNTRNLLPATNSARGIVKPDENTTYIDPQYPGEISVRTSRLDTVDDASNRDGIVRHGSEGYDGVDPRTIKATDGRLNVITANLDKASSSSCGVVKGDGNTIFIDEDGTESVVTTNLDAATEYTMGIVKADNNTISINDGTLSVQTQNLAHATMDSFGIIRPSQWCFDINSYDCLEVKRYADIERLIEENWPEHQEMWKDINDLKNRVAKLETTSVHEMIEVFESAGTLSTVLKYPEKDEDGNIIAYSDKRTIPFKIKCNCKFHAKVDWVNNENPQIKLLYVKYKDSILVNEAELYNTIFDSTDNTVETIEFTFEICNYNRDNNISGINTNAVISVASINNSAVKQTSHHTFTRWNNYAFIDEEKITIDPPAPVEEPIDTTPTDNTTVTRVFIENSERLAIEGNANQENSILFNTTGSKKFYITGKVSYNDILNDGTIVASGDMPLSLSASADKYKIFIKTKEYEYNDSTSKYDKEVTNQFNTPEIISTYSTTGKYNVLNVSSKTSISTKKRKLRIAISFDSTAATEALNETSTNTPTRKEPVLNIDISDKLRNLNPVLLEKVQDSTSQNGITGGILYDSTRVYSVNTGKKSTVTSANLVNTNQNIKYAKVLETRIDNEFIPELEELDRVYTANLANPNITRDRKEKFIEEFDVKSKLVIDKYIGTFKKISDSVSDTSHTQDNYSIIVLEYTEIPNIVEKPSLNAVATIVPGAPYIKFDATRSKGSLLKEGSSSWGARINYRFINSKGNTVSASGENSVSSTVYSITVEGNKDSLSAVQGYPSSAIITQIQNTFKGETTTTGIANVVELNISPKYQNNEGAKSSFPMTVHLTPNVKTPSGLYGVFLVIVPGVAGVFQNTGIIYQQIPGGLSDGSSFSLLASDNTYEHKILLGQLIGLSTTRKSAVYTDMSTINNLESQIPGWEYTDNNHNYFYVPADGRHPTKSVDTTTVTVYNDLAGIKIESVEPIDFMENFVPSVTYSVSGGWNTQPKTNEPAKQTYSFGNAKISSIYIMPWDDEQMTIRFTITGGSTTNIPNGTKIVELTNSNKSKTNFIFVVDGNSYKYTDIIYTDYKFTGGEWRNNQVTVEYMLHTSYKVMPYETQGSNRKLYLSIESGYPQLISAQIMYRTVAHENNNVLNWQQRDMMSMLNPILTRIDGFKFWIGLTMSHNDNINIKDNFESSVSSAADSTKVMINATTFVTGASRSVSIVNSCTTATR